MLSDTRAIPTIPASDMTTMRSFYVDTLGLKIQEERDDGIFFECADGTAVMLFPSSGQASGTHTQMSFMSADFDADVADLRSRGVRFELFDMPGMTEVDGVYTGEGLRGVWFRDPEGNLLALTEVPAAYAG
jgi:catechol 2,3-dioxygenase-like lactoylglutathione lyase family enzyme